MSTYHVPATTGGSYRCQTNDVTCPRCGARPGEPCLSGGYLPVGELPGDSRVGIHRERRAAERVSS